MEKPIADAGPDKKIDRVADPIRGKGYRCELIIMDTDYQHDCCHFETGGESPASTVYTLHAIPGRLRKHHRRSKVVVYDKISIPNVSLQ